MKDLGKVIFYLLATVILGALFAAPLYWGGQWLASQGILAFLGATPFRKFLDRSLLVAALALLWPAARWINVKSVAELGLEPNPRRWQDFAAGFAASFFMMAALGGALVAMGICELHKEIPWAALGKVAASAAVVPVIEEFLFRGAILGLLRRSLSPGLALLAASTLFSILHFLKPRAQPPLALNVGWLTGFALIPGAFDQFKEPLLVAAGFTTLFCVGWILGWARLKTKSLAMPIGLHAGWILGIYGFDKISSRLVQATLPWFGADLKTGLGSVAVVLMTGAAVRVWLRARKAL